MAHKKAAGSAKNLRDSQPKYRGVKLFGGQKVVQGNIIIRQKGNKYECGENVYMGRDFSIHAGMDGFVYFSKKKKTAFSGRKYLKTYVSVTEANMHSSSPDTVTKKASVKKVVTKTIEADKADAVKKETTAKKPTVKKSSTKKTTSKATDTAKKPVVKKTTTKQAVSKTSGKKASV